MLKAFCYSIFICVTLCNLSNVCGQNSDLLTSCPSPSFNNGRSIPLTNTSSAMAVADFNNDGKRDFAVGTAASFGTARVEVQLGNGNGSFTPIDSIATLSFITHITVADFNGDGNLDLLVSHRWTIDSNGVSLLVGNGQGQFTNIRTIPFVGEPWASVAEDFNGDDRMDFAVTDGLQNKVWIYFGDNTGNFSLSASFQVGNSPYSMNKADFNGDGKTDLIVANSNSPFVSILLAANGSFNAPVSISIANNTNAAYISVGDLNGDNKIDAVVDSVGSNFSGASVLIGNGMGGFTLSPFLSFSRGAGRLWLADVSNDNKLDIIATASGFDIANTIRLGNGDGTFGSEIVFAVAGYTFSIEVDDFNSDGQMDLAQSGGGFAEVQIFFGSGNGRFGPATAFVGGQPNSTAPADYNGDGNTDIAVSNYDLMNVQVMSNNGNGNFSITSTIALPERPWSVFSADFNSDGSPDIATINWHTNTGQGRLSVMLNNGNGFAPAVNYFAGSRRFLRSVAVGDLTGDGILDIAVAVVDDRGWLSIFRGNSNGTFVFSHHLAVGQDINAYPPWGVAIGDLNNDGIKDLAATAAGNVFVYLGTGGGNFSPPVLYPAGNPVAELVLADFNEDGILDAAVTNNDANESSPNFVPRVAILLGNGTGGFLAPTIYPTGRGTASIAVADFNNDQNIDLVVGNSYRSAFPDNRVGILYGSGTGTFSAPERFISGINAFDVNVADFNGDGKPDITTANYWNEDVSVLYNTCLPSPPTDFPVLSISSDVSVTELNTGTTNAVYTVSLSAPSSRPVRVEFYTAAGTAFAPNDYAPAKGKLVFQPGETSKTITVSAKGDTRDESDENFITYLVNPLNASLGDRMALTTIIDDDIAGNVQFGNAAYNVAENGGTVTVTITRANGAASDVLVQYATANGTATAGQDYSSVTGSVVFDADETSKTFTVSIINDALDEEPFETVNLSIIGVDGGATIGSPANTVINIEDDDPPPVMNISGLNITEGNQNNVVAQVNLNLLVPSGRNVTVNYATANGTAVSPTDFLAASGQITFAPGETSKTIPVTIIGDTIFEPDETFQVQISNAVNAVIGNATATVTIVNDDAVRNSIADFDGDGKTDISIFRPSVGEWWYLRSSDGGNRAFQFGNSADKITPADFTGDGKTDIAFFRPATGEWYILRSEDFSFYAFPFGTSGDVPVPADYDGDGKADAAVFRESSLTWFISKSTGGTDIIGFGTTGDKPTVGDYDGDGKADIAIYRPIGANGAEWWIRRSSNGSVFATQFGTATDKPVQGDYTGDGKADVAFWRPSNGNWFILRSEDFSFFAFPFGTSGDVPVAGDYDGDGKFDAGVFRPTNQTWFIQRSTAGTLIQTFGIAGDIPTPNAFVP